MASTSAIKELAGSSDKDLFPLVSEGVEHIVTNIARLHDAASSLADAGDHASAAILGRIATEEAAKVLILLDAVRCPPSKKEERERTLACWNSHLWKGLYSEVCDEGLAHRDFSDVEGVAGQRRLNCEPSAGKSRCRGARHSRSPSTQARLACRKR